MIVWIPLVQFCPLVLRLFAKGTVAVSFLFSGASSYRETELWNESSGSLHRLESCTYTSVVLSIKDPQRTDPTRHRKALRG